MSASLHLLVQILRSKRENGSCTALCKILAFSERTNTHSAVHISLTLLVSLEYGAMCRILAVAIEFGPCFMDFCRTLNQPAAYRTTYNTAATDSRAAL
jgi:hypothetical protein